MYPGERFNAWTHLFGAVLALTGAVWLVVIAAASGDLLKTVSVTVYGLTLVTLYSISTVYHSVRGRAKRINGDRPRFSVISRTHTTSSRSPCPVVRA
jgi:hemolysin III